MGCPGCGRRFSEFEPLFIPVERISNFREMADFSSAVLWPPLNKFQRITTMASFVSIPGWITLEMIVVTVAEFNINLWPYRNERASSDP